MKDFLAQSDGPRIPEDWTLGKFADFGVFRSGNGFPLVFQGHQSGDYPFFKVSDLSVKGNELFMRNANHYISENVRKKLRAASFPPGSIVFAHIGAAIFLERKRLLSQPSCLDNNMMAFTLVDNHACPRFFYFLFLHTELGKLVSTTALPALSGKHIGALSVAVPSPAEQRAIAEVLSDVDGLIGALDALIAKKRAIKQATMQQLLSGKTRLPAFSGKWETKQIGDAVDLCSEKNKLGTDFPVLTCSKHLGFVDSLSYFKNQVFSNDLSSYKIIRRGQIGYPMNHVEEGSIGLQDLYEVALVSPIYIVCSPTEDVNSYFLHRLLKLDSYRQEFAKATTSSIDRRGSLRWRAFSKIRVTLPPIDEQGAIASVLSDMEAEVAALERRRDKSRAIKQGMMQQLLTGRVRLVESRAISNRSRETVFR